MGRSAVAAPVVPVGNGANGHGPPAAGKGPLWPDEDGEGVLPPPVLRRMPLLCGNNSRFVLLVLATLCMTAISANSLLLNFTVICMGSGNSSSPSSSSPSSSSPSSCWSANFSTQQKGVLIAGTALGGILAIGPVPPLIAMFGLRLVFSVFGLLSGLVTALTPLLFRWAGGFYALLAVRLVQGFCLMPAMPAISQVTHHWANTDRPGESALFLTLLSLYMQLGIILVMPTAGWLCESAWGWPSAYYLFGCLSLLLFLIFLLLYRNSPAQSRFISEQEFRILSASQWRHQGGEVKKRAEQVPYRAMLSDRAVWATVACGIGSGLAYWLFAQYGPTYMNKVLHYQVDQTGVWVAVPYLCAIFAKLMVPAADRLLPGLSARFRLVGLIFVCQLANVGCCCLLGLAPANRLLAQTAVIAVLCANGAGFVALCNNCQMLARQHAHCILALFALTNYLITLVQPLAISWLAADDSPAQWSRIFFAYGLMLLALDIVFLVFARVSPASWTDTSGRSRESHSCPAKGKERF